MTLEVLMNEMVAAMKNKDKARKEVLSGLVGAVKKTAIDKKCKDNISEALVDEVLLKEKKTIQEQIDTCPKDREDKLVEYKAAMAVIDEFAPQLVTDETIILGMIHGILDYENVDRASLNKGILMKTVMPKLKGKVDMKIAQKVIGGMC